MTAKLTRRRLVQTASVGAAAAGVGPWIIREANGADKIKVASNTMRQVYTTGGFRMPVSTELPIDQPMGVAGLRAGRSAD